MPVFIPNSKLIKVRNEFANSLIEKYGINAKAAHDTLQIIGITIARKAYDYLMSILSPLEKGTVLTSAQLEDLYISMTKKYGVDYKIVYGSIVCAFNISWNCGDVDVLIKMFGRQRLFSSQQPENLEYINAIIKYISELNDDIIVY